MNIKFLLLLTTISFAEANWNTTKAWDVFLAESPIEGCVAAWRSDSDLRLVFGLDNANERFFVSMAHPSIFDLHNDRTVDVLLDFDGDKSWNISALRIESRYGSVAILGQVHDAKLVRGFQKSFIMSVNVDGAKPERVDLFGSYQAVESAIECHEHHFGQSDWIKRFLEDKN